MVGDCNDTLGVAVLTSVSLGRGGSMTEATVCSNGRAASLVAAVPSQVCHPLRFLSTHPGLFY